MIDIREELKTIRASDYFKNGLNGFWLYNYTFFRILDEATSGNFNGYVDDDDDYTGKKIFALGCITFDDDPESYLCFDDSADNGIFIKSANQHFPPKQMKRIANNISDFFNDNDYLKYFISKQDIGLNAWMERTYHSSDTNVKTPNGVLPGFDIRDYFKNSIPGTLLGDHKEINTKEFLSYFNNFGAKEFIPRNFGTKYLDDELLDEIVETINSSLGKAVFYKTRFNPSWFWGIGNYEVLNDDMKKLLFDWGIL